MIITGETNEQYHASGAWGSTRINDFIKSPAIAFGHMNGTIPKQSSRSLDIGSALHARFDDTYSELFAVGPTATRTAKAWKDAVKATTKTLLTPSEVSMIDAMEKSIQANSMASFLLRDGQSEVALRSDSPYGDYRVQCKADRLNSQIIDIKTTTNLDDFVGSITKYGYYKQAAFYQWLIAEEIGEKLPFAFVVVEKSAPYRCRVIDLSDDFMLIGWQEVEHALIGIGKCYRQNKWDDPTYQQISPPSWLANKHELCPA